MKTQAEFEAAYLGGLTNVSQKTKDALYSAYTIGYTEKEKESVLESINRLSRDKKESE